MVDATKVSLYLDTAMTVSAFRALAVVIIVLIAGSAVYLARSGWPGEVVTASGMIVRDMSPLEAGAFAGDDAKVLRLAYLESLVYYRTLELNRLIGESGFVQEQTRRVLEQGLDGSSRFFRELERFGGANLEGLVEAVTLTLSRAAGVRWEDYVPLNRGGKLRLPENIGKLTGSAVEPADKVAIEQIYRDRFRASAQPGSADRIVAIAGDSHGWRIGARFNPAGLDRVVVQDALTSTLTADDALRFRGYVTQSSLVFRSRGGDPEDKPIAAVSLAVIVEDASGDRYPLWMTFQRFRGDRTWWLSDVYRAVSIRALAKPPLVF